MHNLLVGMTAETFIHPGAGQADGAIDLPVSREAVTQYPFVPGSGVKGAMRDALGIDDTSPLLSSFGGEAAGGVIFSDARLLLLPIRSLSDAYLWATCPTVLDRLRRDCERAGMAAGFTTPQVSGFNALFGPEVREVYLEEQVFSRSGAVPDQVIAAISRLLHHDMHRTPLARRLVVLSDEAFGWFARYGLAVQAHNVLEDGTKRSENLWYEETLPPDTVMYIILGERSRNALATGGPFRTAFDGLGYLQLGGNETVGQGWFALHPVAVEA